jgi:CheY-like chemotaxis protein
MTCKATVLIVDDDEAITRMFRFLIESSTGCRVVTASNGLEALEELRKDIKPCMILLDLMMPIMNGWQLDCELARDPQLSLIPTIIITAFPEKSLELKRHLRVVQKPVNIETILDLVKKHCSHRE